MVSEIGTDIGGEFRGVQWWSVVVSGAGLVDSRGDLLVLDNPRHLPAGRCDCLV